MCRLLGVIANKPVDLEFSLLRANKPFRNFGKSNPDGWGIGWYENSLAKVFKRSLSALNDHRFDELSKEVSSKIIIAHVRRGTGGVPSEQNSHPFQYKNWIFAHNGSIDREFLFGLLKDKYRENVKGETDSEVYFYWILQCIEECRSVLKGIKKAVKKVITNSHTGLNFLLSNGVRLYAFRYSNNSREYYSLYLLRRISFCDDLFKVVSDETGALLKSKSLRGEKAVLICSEKLTEENWEEIKVASLVTIGQDLNIRIEQIL
jgi:glutamine amidotransferase